MTRPYHQMCPIARTLDIVGERWTLLIVRDLLLGKTRFNDLMASSPMMPARVLSDRLKMLEAKGFVARALYSEHPPRSEYTLTALGRSLEPVAEALFRWGAEHTLNHRQRRVVSQHLYGPAAPRSGVLEFPGTRARVAPQGAISATKRSIAKKGRT